ncbi:hypothetical protein LCM23_17215 [Cytobacillus kochii]|uniref:hypothetical protein n=1 Tax=Cytobacillus kochii TaxID=859143 RepID=UPI001CD6C9EF|nr:hypothetical protein [Cytobacillus kochii]MCA1027837.1 hypothetical protein [Cytobacillus kochii]
MGLIYIYVERRVWYYIYKEGITGQIKIYAKKGRLTVICAGDEIINTLIKTRIRFSRAAGNLSEPLL